LATNVLSPIIYRERDAFGYRSAYWLMAAMLVAVALVTLPLLRERPDDTGPVKPVGKKPGKTRDWIGMDYADAKKKPYFYAAAVCIFLTGMCLQGLYGISAAHMKDSGIPADRVASVLSVLFLGLAVSKFLTGYSYDKLGMRFTMTFCNLCAVLASFLLSTVSASAMGIRLASAHALFTALALPLETIMLSLFASELFGNRAFPHTMGLFSAVNTAGYAVGTPVANWCFDTMGTYVPVILGYCGIMAAVTVAFLFILRAAYRDRKIILAQEAVKNEEKI
jgi:predicted MFS family arabinose efflux permease